MTFPQYRKFKGGAGSGHGGDKSKIAPDYSGTAEKIALEHEEYFRQAAQFTPLNFNPTEDELNRKKLAKAIKHSESTSLSDTPPSRNKPL